MGGGAATEIEAARIVPDTYAQLETLGLTLDDEKRIAAAVHREAVQAQASVMGEIAGTSNRGCPASDNVGPEPEAIWRNSAESNWEVEVRYSN